MEMQKAIIDKIQEAINWEQSPAHREKPLTLGLQRAIEIVNAEYKDAFNQAYERKKEESESWETVTMNDDIPSLLRMGFIIRRKK